MTDKAMYLTDDRDLPLDDQRALVIFPGGNGDWYLQVTPHHGRSMDGVRICTSGGAASACPGLPNAIAEAYRCMKAAADGVHRDPGFQSELPSQLAEAKALFEEALEKAVKADKHDVPFGISCEEAATWHRAQASSLQWVLEMLP